jgi:endonuclease III
MAALITAADLGIDTRTDQGLFDWLVRTASTRDEISQRLQRFKGVGPKTAEIFLREVPDALIGTA